MSQPSASAVPEQTDAVDGKSGNSGFALVRYGAVPQVAWFGLPETELPDGFARGTPVIVATERGTECGLLLRTVLSEIPNGGRATGNLHRAASDTDRAEAAKQAATARGLFSDWEQRIVEWKVDVTLLDCELTLDDQLVLYVLNDRNAETTRLAIQAAADGHGIIHVQPVSAEGVTLSPQGGCGSGGCGCSH